MSASAGLAAASCSKPGSSPVGRHALSIAYTLSESWLVFADGRRRVDDRHRVDIVSQAVTARYAVDVPSRWNLGVSVGTSTWARITRRSDRESLTARWGLSAALTASREWLGPNPHRLFFSTSCSLAVAITQFDGKFTSRESSARTTTRPDPMIATDISVNLILGYNFPQVASPYVATRLFGGPVIWDDIADSSLGSDPRHFAVAVGALFRLPRGFQLGLDGAFLGSRGITGMFGVRL